VTARSEQSCPCGSRQGYDACCGRLHRGEAEAATAEQLMRSRYSAFAEGDVAYLRRTWHPLTCPTHLVLDPSDRWTRLDILASTAGGMFDTEGTVAFEAHHRGGVMRELSRFERLAGRWVYVAAVTAVHAVAPVTTVDPAS
jgi:SEC-C motif-containing protein